MEMWVKVLYRLNPARAVTVTAAAGKPGGVNVVEQQNETVRKLLHGHHLLKHMEPDTTKHNDLSDQTFIKTKNTPPPLHW